MFIPVFNPLEQFEPVPFLKLFLGSVNFSLTSVSVMCIFLLFIFVFLLGSPLKIISRKKAPKAFTHSTRESLFSSSKFMVTLMYNLIASHKSLGSSLASYTTSHMKRYLKVLSTQILASTEGSTSLTNTNMGPLMVQRYSISALELNNSKSLIKARMTGSSSITGFSQNTFVPKPAFFVFETIFVLILDMVKNTIGHDKKSISFFPIVFTLFLFLLVSNLSGLVPYGTTITAYLIVTFTLSTMVMVAVTLYAFNGHGLRFLGHFLPGGTPGWLIPFIIPIEMLSFVFRVVSLAVRLFANMMAGHTLLAVLAGFGWSMALGANMICIWSPAPVLVVFILVGLETAVALIQAYVFTILTCIYVEESINIH